eukprot:scaffold48373_cov27-Tisochrysis_lutea.AAC.1
MADGARRKACGARKRKHGGTEARAPAPPSTVQKYGGLHGGSFNTVNTVCIWPPSTYAKYVSPI